MTSPKGQFESQCTCLLHEDAVAKYPNETELFVSTHARKVPYAVRKWIEDNNYFKVQKYIRVRNICQACVHFCEEQIDRLDVKKPKLDPLEIIEPTTSKGLTASHHVPDCSYVVQCITSGLYSPEEVCKLACAIGMYSKEEVVMFSKTQISSNKVESLQQSYLDAWDKNNCGVYKSFMTGVTDWNRQSGEKLRHTVRWLQKSLECVCSVINYKFISGMALAENIVLHVFSNSRTACRIFARSQACGSYSYLLNTLEEIAKYPPPVPCMTISIAFDNQQVIAKEWRVSVSPQKISVVTAISAFQAESNKRSECYEEVSTALAYPVDNPEELWHKFEKFEEECIQEHRKFREDWIRARFDIIIQEINTPLLTEEESLQQTINHDDYENGINYSRIESQGSTYRRIDLENLIINPNSYKNVKLVLDNILEKVEHADNKRKWVVVQCDGLPYSIASKLIHDTWMCMNCSVEGSHSKMSDHRCDLTSDPPVVHRKFEKLILRPGFGHFEVNLVRSIITNYFDIFIEPVAKLMGFVAPKSLLFCRRATDHHKSWQLLQIIYVSLTDELIYYYVKQATKAGVKATPETYKAWKANLEHKNYNLASDFVYNILHPLFLFRAGVRQCNEKISLAGLNKSSALFFGFNHPKYRDITAKDLFYCLSLPKTEASSYIKNNSFRMETSTVGQGLDFCLEERNHDEKEILPSRGAPTEHQWKRSSSLLSFYQEIKRSVFKNLDLNMSQSSDHTLKMSPEYFETRKYFRKFLLECKPDVLTSFTTPAKTINHACLNWAFKCQQNRMEYFKSFVWGEKCAVSNIEIEDVDLMSKEDLLKKIKARIVKFSPPIKQYYDEKLFEETDLGTLVDIFWEVDEETYYNSSTFGLESS